MSATGFIRGRRVEWSDEKQAWLWADWKSLAEGWGGVARPCPRCGLLPTQEGYDPCIGHIAGAISACCGHGVEWPSVTYEDKRNA